MPKFSIKSLGDLKSFVEYIYSEEYKNMFKEKYNNDCYYSILIKPETKVITTNYTPILIFYSDHVAHLAGSMDMFEVADKLKVENIKKINEDENFFPFLFLQSPVKPIVHPCQIKEYNKAINYLNCSKTLVVLGYNFNDDDNHITAMIRDWIASKEDKNESKKSLIYFGYGKDRNETKEEIINKLRIADCGLNLDNLKFVEFSSLKDIKHYMEKAASC